MSFFYTKILLLDLRFSCFTDVVVLLFKLKNKVPYKAEVCQFYRVKYNLIPHLNMQLTTGFYTYSTLFGGQYILNSLKTVIVTLSNRKMFYKGSV